MPNRYWLGVGWAAALERLGTIKAVARQFISQLTTAAITQELHRDALLTMEQLTTSITVLAVHSSHRPEDTPRVRAVFEQLLETIHQAETDMEVFDLP
jgi:hypothetical protein